MTHKLYNAVYANLLRMPKPFRPALVTVLVALLSAGCFTPTQRIKHHLAVNPNRPEAVKQALLQDHQVIPGMLPEEVRLVLGSPELITNAQADSPPVWHYYRKTRADGKLQNSAMWQLPIPLQTVFFGTDNTVTNVIGYDNEPTAPRQHRLEIESGHESTSAESQETVNPETVAVDRPSKPKSVISSYQPPRDELNVFGWPKVALQGITTNGRSHRAILNGVICEPGDFIGEVRLDSVYANGVALEYQKQRAFLRPGESTARQNKE